MTAERPFLFHVDPSWRRDGIHTFLLNPWWGNPYDIKSVIARDMFDHYAPDTRQYGITDDIDAADMVLAPYRHNWLMRTDSALLATCIQTARTANLPLLVDGMGDIEHPVEAPGVNVFVLRYSGYRFLPDPTRVQAPLTVDDLLERCRDGVLEIRKKQEGKPKVGFAGWATLTLSQRLKTLIKELPVRARAVLNPKYRTCTKGVLWRVRALSLLGRSPLVSLIAKERKTFSASPKTVGGDMRELREEMVRVILESDYALDVRGDGNNSGRLFEILSLGRIPVILDTERILPFADRVDYSSFALIVDFRDLPRLPERIAEFHESISPERFEEMQRNARSAFVQYFRVDAIMKTLVPELRVRIASR